jgi:hypothetical protein
MAALSSRLKTLRSRCVEIDRCWRAVDFDYEKFPNVVRDIIGDLDLTPFGAVDQVVQLLDDPEIGELQRLSSFSDLYFKLFDNGRFWVEILNWWGSDINIHDHDFAGVQFQLAGHSLNVGYDFVEDGLLGGLVTGHLVVSGAELWQPGDFSIVEPGRKAPHNVCHIDVPTVSLLIRTHPNPAFGPQWNYFPPGIAGSYGIASPTFRKRVQALRLLARGELSVFCEAFRDFCDRASIQELLFGLAKMVDILFDRDKVGLVHELAGQSPQNEAVVEAVVFFRAVESVKYFKNSRALPWRKQFALSVVASGSNRDQFREIVEYLRSSGVDPGFDDPLVELGSLSDDASGRRIEDTLAIFDTVFGEQVKNH